MSIIAQIKVAQVVARKARENETAAVLTTLIGEAEMVGKNANREVTDQEVIAVIKKFLKGMDETIQILSVDHPQVEFVEHEKSVLQAFLPKQLTEEELADHIRDIHAGLVTHEGKADMGRIQRVLKERFTGLYDGKLATDLIKKELA